MNKPLLSIVVPTKNRYVYLYNLIDLIASFKSDDIEMVVQDNSDDNSEFLNRINLKEYPFISYFYESKTLSQAGNSDYAVRNSRGEYICFIGDDDGVTKDILACCKWMKKNGVECALPERIVYYWPDAYSGSVGNLKTEVFTGKVSEQSTQDVLIEVLNRGCIDRGNLPLLYHGIVKKEILDIIWNKCGTYFPGASPDIANGVSLCMIIDKFLKISAPLVISGISKCAAGGINSLKHHAETDLSKVSQLPSNISEIWCERIPRIWTNPTIWCESVVEALNAWDRKDLIERLDFEKLYEYFAAFYGPYKYMAYKLTKNKIKLITNSCILKFRHYWDALDRRVRRVLHLEHEHIEVKGLKNIREVCYYFESKGYKFQDAGDLRA
mgnify:CR=1 FL=1